MATIEEIDAQYRQLEQWRNAWGDDPAVGRNYTQQMQALVAQRDKLAAQQASDNDAWHKARGTGPYATANGGTDSSSGALARQRQNAFETLTSLFRNFGLDIDSGGLSSQLWSWVQEDRSADWIRVEIRNTEAYKARFPGMADLMKRGQYMDEATYVEQERQYRQVLKSFDLPVGFYDRPDDFSKFIVNQVSVKELSDRITTAKTFLDENTDPNYRQSLEAYYGINQGSMLAYAIDADRATPLVEKQMKAAQAAGAAAKFGFGTLSQGQAERYGATLGDQFDSFGADARNQLEASMAQLSMRADNDARLASIDQDAAFQRTDVLDASLLNDTEKQLASSQRGMREKARFSGSGGFGAGSLGRSSGV